MNRRTAVRNVMLLSAGVALLPSCFRDEKGSLILKNISVGRSDEAMLAALSDVIIPKSGTFIGAADLKAHEFVLLMVDDCTSPEDQQKFVAGMKSFDQLCPDKFGQIFSSCTPDQKKTLLADIEKKKTIPEDVQNFYGMVKRYTLQSFTSSKQYMTDIKHYKMVPGSNFKGCISI